MELSEKIQMLRREHDLSQEQLAERLFVTRTAVSKWETGRGTPNIESLKAIARLFNISLDELLSTDQIAVLAEKESRQNISCFALYIDGVLNLIAATGLFFPLYKSQISGVFYSVPLYQFSGLLSVLYWIFPIAMVLCGAAQILLNKTDSQKIKTALKATGILSNIAAIFALVSGGQPYPAVMFLSLLLIKGAVLLKKRR